MDGPGDRVKKAGERARERWREAAGEVRGREEGGREMRGSDATEKRVKKKKKKTAARGSEITFHEVLGSI